MRLLAFTILFIAVSALAALRFDLVPQPFRISPGVEKHTAVNVANAAMTRARQKARKLKEFCAENGYDSTRCFLLDMSLHSGKNRFFVYRMDKDSIEMNGLVAHGSGSDQADGVKKYSNQPNSHCTSLGRYSIGHSYNGQFGLAYKLYGLDATNSNAFKRYVVLHAHECVPNGEVYPMTICRSFGCPTVSPDFLTKLKPLIDNSTRPLLLWIYDK